MNRRSFLQASATTLLLAGTNQLKAEETSSMTANSPLKVRFLGTGAADWNGRDDRGELRRLSSILIDDRILIDFTFTCEDMIPSGVHPKAIFYTHSHGDHYNAEAALKLKIPRIFISETWIDRGKHDFEQAAKKLGVEVPEINPLAIGTHVHIDNLIFTPLPANHATEYLQEQTLIYLVEKEKARILYATDTGGIPSIAARLAGIDYHIKGKPITGLIMESTMGMGMEDDYRLFTHSSVETVMRTITVLQKYKRYKPAPEQSVYITHLARTLHGTQEELDSMLPKPIKAAYDGLEVTFQ